MINTHLKSNKHLKTFKSELERAVKNALHSVSACYYYNYIITSFFSFPPTVRWREFRQSVHSTLKVNTILIDTIGKNCTLHGII